MNIYKFFQNKYGGDRCSVDSSDLKLTQTPIISMEDDEISDQESVSFLKSIVKKKFCKSINTC